LAVNAVNPWSIPRTNSHN